MAGDRKTGDQGDGFGDALAPTAESPPTLEFRTTPEAELRERRRRTAQGLFQTRQSDHIGPRRFCFLQGPHGPFFAELADALTHLGHSAFRIGFNRGDQTFWDGRPYRAWRDSAEAWAARAGEVLRQERVTDLVVYGDVRGYHAHALEAARRIGIRTHLFEEGYIRPYWITYEREGLNAASPLMALDLNEIDEATLPDDPLLEVPPSHWGELNAHVYHGLRYHWLNQFMNWRYPEAQRTSSRTAWQEWRGTYGRALAIPYLTMRRRWRKQRLYREGRPYHLVLLQLRWDASIQRHSPYNDMGEVVRECVRAFAPSSEGGAAERDLLVFKTHPLEDGMEGLPAIAREAADEVGLDFSRIRFIDGGKLGQVLEPARSVVTVNSTAGQQALWRGKPVKTLGAAIYDKPGLVSQQSLPAFFADPEAGDPGLYRRFRRLMLATSQIRGGFYTRAGRTLALENVARAMLATDEPYARFVRQTPQPAPATPHPKVKRSLP
ncbi:MAG: capsule biosynthesis protein CapA [Pseudomonadota bacterium]